MLDSLTLLRAMNGIHGEDVVMAGKTYFESRKTRTTRRIVHLTLLAAVLISLLTIGAYASNFLGLKAIMIPEATIEISNTPALAAQPQAETEEIGSAAPVSAPEPQEAAEQADSNALVSITQPQAVPEELRPFGKVFEILEVLPLNNRTMKEAGKRWPQAEVTARNVPMTSDLLRKKTGCVSGGDIHLFGVRADAASEAGNYLIVTKKRYETD